MRGAERVVCAMDTTPVGSRKVRSGECGPPPVCPSSSNNERSPRRMSAPYMARPPSPYYLPPGNAGRGCHFRQWGRWQGQRQAGACTGRFRRRGRYKRGR